MRRFSIAGLMVVVLICGVGVAALVNASEMWAGVMTCATLLLLQVAILGAAFRREKKRAFWVGFAVFGWGYLLFSQNWVPDAFRLPTTRLLAMAHERMVP